MVRIDKCMAQLKIYNKISNQIVGGKYSGFSGSVKPRGTGSYGKDFYCFVSLLKKNKFPLPNALISSVLTVPQL